MHPRSKAREYAVQVLFLWDANGSPDSELAIQAIQSGTVLEGATDLSSIGPDTRADAMDMARGAWLEREATDKRLEFHAPQWPPKRQPGVDRAILRLAVWELGHKKTPPKVILDEAIELAKRYSTEQSPSFINGVLDAILREYQAVTKGLDGLPNS